MSEQHKVNRPKRPQIELTNRLAAKQREGYIRRWVNEDRYMYCVDLGYTPVVGDDEDVSQVLTQDPSKQGSSLIRRDVGLGKHAILMEISEELYKEYRARRQAEVDASEDGLRGVHHEPGSYGETKIERK